MVKNTPAMWETGFDLWIRKILWRRKWQPTVVFLPREFHRQRILVGYSPWSRKELDMTEQLTLSLHCHVLITYCFNKFSSVQFSCSVVSDSLQPHEPQHARPPCLSPTPRVHSNSSIESMMPSSHLILCRPLFLLPPIPPSIRVFTPQQIFIISQFSKLMNMGLA